MREIFSLNPSPNLQARPGRNLRVFVTPLLEMTHSASHPFFHGPPAFCIINSWTRGSDLFTATSSVICQAVVPFSRNFSVAAIHACPQPASTHHGPQPASALLAQ